VKLDFKSLGQGYVARPDDFGVLAGLATLFKLNDDQVELSNAAAAIQKLVGEQGSAPGHILALVALLKGDARAALEQLSLEIHQAHCACFG
jgi:hypothetical protein